ncbi:hypothetical protein VP01_842g4 [Puccinia sorghi]|uniref:Uncharacterized protein n=1 Tax=Puccinia sorghi TaxID=27349 RepID=A0A0L6UBG2_9BASI|nr:hypothetical protein VP01_842g4 [Puccinia sorghi]
MEVLNPMRGGHDALGALSGGRGADQFTKTFSEDAHQLANGSPDHSNGPVLGINGPFNPSLRPPNQAHLVHTDPISLHTPPSSETVIKAVPTTLRTKQPFFSSVKAFFRRLPNIFSRSPRTFSYAPKLATEFGKLREIQPQDLKPFVDSFVSDLVNHPALWKASIHGDPRLDEIEYIKQQTLSDLGAIREFITRTLPEREQAASALSQKISENLKIILENPPYVKSKNPIGNLASQLARMNSRSLQASRRGIREHLDSRVAYMADLHGLLGPQNVFSSPITSILKDESLVGNLPDGFQAEEFVRELENLQPHLTALDNYKFFVDKPGKGRGSFPPQLTAPIDQSDQNLAKLVGGTPALSKLITKLENSEPYRAFQAELASPKETAGYELAFVEPLGIARNHKIEDRRISHLHDFPVALDRPVDGIRALNGPARGWAKQNTADRLVSASEARQLRENLLKIYTPEGVDYLANKIRPANPSSV